MMGYDARANRPILRPFDDAAWEKALKAKRLHAAWSEWLGQFRWDHFATATFAEQPTDELAMWELRRWLRRLAQRARRPVDGFLALERGSLGRLHGHCLLIGTSTLNTAAIVETWMRPTLAAAARAEGKPWTTGQCDVQRYDKSRGAAWYVTKDIAGRIVEYSVPRRHAA